MMKKTKTKKMMITEVPRERTVEIRLRKVFPKILAERKWLLLAQWAPLPYRIKLILLVAPREWVASKLMKLRISLKTTLRLLLATFKSTLMIALVCLDLNTPLMNSTSSSWTKRKSLLPSRIWDLFGQPNVMITLKWHSIVSSVSSHSSSSEKMQFLISTPPERLRIPALSLPTDLSCKELFMIPNHSHSWNSKIENDRIWTIGEKPYNQLVNSNQKHQPSYKQTQHPFTIITIKLLINKNYTINQH